MNPSPLSFVRQSIESVYQAAKQRLRRWAQPDNHDPVLNAAMDLTRTRSELLLENRLLRQQLIVLKRQAKRPALTWHDQGQGNDSEHRASYEITARTVKFLRRRDNGGAPIGEPPPDGTGCPPDQPPPTKRSSPWFPWDRGMEHANSYTLRFQI